MAACYDNDFSAPHVYNRLFLIKSRFSYSHARVHCEIRTDVHIPKCRSDKNRFWDKDIFTQSFAAFCPNKEITRRTRQRLINTYTFGRKKTLSRITSLPASARAPILAVKNIAPIHLRRFYGPNIYCRSVRARKMAR